MTVEMERRSMFRRIVSWMSERFDIVHERKEGINIRAVADH